ncbi:hypothetical protein FQA39_LY01580 [Lamprigera yunnana]|nr:hypothetical protein FQA39_LY01580 [Lamprigera yunnana]
MFKLDIGNIIENRLRRIISSPGTKQFFRMTKERIIVTEFWIWSPSFLTVTQGNKPVVTDALVGLQAPSTISSGNLIFPKKILPLPKVVPKQSVRGSRKRSKTVIVTTSLYMKELKDCQTQRCVKPPKQVKKDLFSEVPTSSKNCTQNRKLSSKSVKKDARSSSSESYDSDDICQGSDISDFICDEGDELFEDSETKFTLDQKEICLNDFVSVLLKEIKKQVLKEFVGQIIAVVEEESNDSEVDYKVKFMRNYCQHADIFVFPEVEEITGVLSKFNILRHGKILFS